MMRETWQRPKIIGSFFVNAILAYPLLIFLINPDNSSKELPSQVMNIFLLKIVSFSVITGLTSNKLSKRLRITSWIIPLLLLYYVYDRTGLELILYFIGGLIVDALLLYKGSTSVTLNNLLNSIARMFLIIFLLVPSLLVGAIIYNRYVPLLMSGMENILVEDVRNQITLIILFVLYYMLEPFSGNIFDSVFDPKSRFRKRIHL